MTNSAAEKADARVPGDGLSLEVMRPVEAHARTLHGWRSDPDVLAASFHPAPVPWPDFWAAFSSSYFDEPDLPPLFVTLDGRRVGYLRFRSVSTQAPSAQRTVDISIGLDASSRGRGLGREAVGLALAHLRRHSDVGVVLAEVRVGNGRSGRMFLAAGFEPAGEVDKVVADTGERARVRQFVYRLRSGFFQQDRVLVIAEAGSNWRSGTEERDLAMARALIDVAAEAGADAVKFQVFRAATTYAEAAGMPDYLGRPQDNRDIRDLFDDLAMPYAFLPELADYARRCGLRFMATPFSRADFEAVDSHVSVHKIASYELRHVELIRLAARSGKPTVMSTGASDVSDIAWAVEQFRDAGGTDLCLMQCSACYPAPVDALNLRVIPWLSRRFGVAAGFSDHSKDPLAGPMAAVALGARAIEKHFTLSNRLPGPDHAFAVDPKGLARMIQGIRSVEISLGDGIKQVLPVEQELAGFARRGLQATRVIAKGEPLVYGENFDILRPGRQHLGAHPRFLDAIDGRKASRDIPAGDGIAVDDGIA